MSNNVGVKFKMKDIAQILRERGLMGKAQKILDSEVMRVMKPYMPKDTGEMIRSIDRSTNLGSGEIIVNTPYAHRRLKSARKNGLRGPEYFERMKADKKDQLMRVVEKVTGGKGK